MMFRLRRATRCSPPPKKLGYVPNKIAGALASQRVNLVGVIIPSLANMVFPEVLRGISSGLEDTGLQPVFGATDYQAEREENVIYEMLSWRPSGVIVAGLEHTDAARAMLANAGIPIVEIMDIDGEAIDSVVGISHRRAGRDMAQAILQAGYRRIGFLGTKRFPTISARANVWKASPRPWPRPGCPWPIPRITRAGRLWPRAAR